MPMRSIQMARPRFTWLLVGVMLHHVAYFSTKEAQILMPGTTVVTHLSTRRRVQMSYLHYSSF